MTPPVSRPGIAALSAPAVLACAAAFMGPMPAAAQAPAWPAKPIRLVVPFAVGGGADILGRLFAQKLSEQLGRSVVVDTRAGAGGNVGAEITARAPADGYTVMFTTNSMAVNVSLYPKLNYDAIADLRPVALVAAVPLVLVVHPLVPAKSVKELVALAKKRPGGLNFGSNGSGTTSHLSGVLLADLTKSSITHIPYKGAGAVITALLGGEVDMGFVGAVGATPHLKAGRLRPLAVSTAQRSSNLPDVPTMASMFPGFETDAWYGFFVPTGTPVPVVSRLYEEIRKAQGAADVKAAMARDGADPRNLGPDDFPAFFRQEVEKYAKLVKLAGAKAE
ncbi:MAG: tripartite tricarboxylate transporter substrate binding protein [Rhodocyclaceae bacterium]|nr:tripartite tricarboxylate transporter substrate binding protein [Rhodocyclaceae bacterium]MCA3105914.1 tripartite tricarboxylate transporter substrate binding protein [Rhodocyclaceae bacterium]